MRHTHAGQMALFSLTAALSTTAASADITVMQVPGRYRVEPDSGRCAVSSDGRTLMLPAYSNVGAGGYRVLVWEVGGTIAELQALL